MITTKPGLMDAVSARFAYVADCPFEAPAYFSRMRAAR